MVNAVELATEPENDVPASMNLGTILIIEDDPRMQRTLQRAFAHEHYATAIAGDGQGGLDLFRSERPLAVVLDLILPSISGRELCRIFKQQSSEVPVIVLSAITEVADKVLLLELGADDYVTKPFSPRELTARVQAAIRRLRKPAAQTVSLWRVRGGFQEDDDSSQRETRRAHGTRIQAAEILHRQRRARVDARCPAE